MDIPMPRLRRRELLAAAFAALAPAVTLARGFPNGPVKLIVPQPPGGAADMLARLFAERLGAQWKQNVIVENRPGGGVIVGTQALVHAPADGNTIALLGSSLSINAAQRKDLPYRIQDLQPLARIGYYTMALVARADFPANNVAELVALAKKEPGKLSFGSNGIGTSAQVAGDMLNRMAGIEMQHVPYNGASKMYTDMIGGLVPLGFSVASSAEGFIRAGQLKVLGVTSPKRSPLFPQWPAIAETLPGYEAVNWAGFCGPAGLPPAITSQLADAMLAVLEDTGLQKTLARAGIEPAPLGAREFQAFIDEEIRRFGALTHKANPKS